jgi:hypothetical protein
MSRDSVALLLPSIHSKMDPILGAVQFPNTVLHRFLRCVPHSYEMLGYKCSITQSNISRFVLTHFYAFSMQDDPCQICIQPKPLVVGSAVRCSVPFHQSISFAA